MQKVKKHSGLTKGEKRYAMKMVLIEMSFVVVIVSASIFLITTML